MCELQWSCKQIKIEVNFQTYFLICFKLHPLKYNIIWYEQMGFQMNVINLHYNLVNTEW